MGAVPGIHHMLLSSALISLLAAIFLHGADNFQTQIKGVSLHPEGCSLGSGPRCTQ